MNKLDIKKRKLLKCLEKNLGIVTAACSQANVPRSTHYLWYAQDDEYRAAVDGIADLVLDFVESQLHKKIKDRDTAATIFYMKTKGKKRGYIERVENEISGRSGGPIVLNLDNDCKPIEGTGTGL